jgi:hypothetical protein
MQKKERISIFSICLIAGTIEGLAMAAMELLEPLDQYPGGVVLYTACVAAFVCFALLLLGKCIFRLNGRKKHLLKNSTAFSKWKITSINFLPLFIFGGLDLGGIWYFQPILEVYFSRYSFIKCFILGFLSGWFPSFILIIIYNLGQFFSFEQTKISSKVNLLLKISFKKSQISTSGRILKTKKESIAKVHPFFSVFLAVYEGLFFVWHYYLAYPLQLSINNVYIKHPSFLSVFISSLLWFAGGALSVGVSMLGFRTTWHVFSKKQAFILRSIDG